MNIVFDFGAVVFTWQPATLIQQVFAQRADSVDVAKQLAHQVFGHADWHAFDQGLLQADEVVQRTAQRLSLPLDAMQELVHGIGERLMPIEGTLLLLEQLRQRRDSSDWVTGLYYLSNMPVPYARVLEQRFAFLRWFDGGVFSGDVKHIKPDPLIYQMLQERYQLPAAHTVFVDDLKANVHVAQSLGWRGIHFESPQQLQAELSLLGL